MPQFSRRTALSAFALASALASAGFLASCAPEQRPRPTGTATTPRPSRTAPPSGDASSAPLGTYGPTGANWPSRTPRTEELFDFDEECDCTWGAIEKAITRAVTSTSDGKARVRVKPGALSGNGAGSRDQPVLQGLGAENRPFRVLVSPRDGVGSVTVDDSIRIDNVTGVSFVGFWLAPYGIVLTSVRDFAWAWSKGIAFNISSSTSGPVEDAELVECVTPDASAKASDTWAFRTGEYPYRDIAVRGCYLAPSYKPDGSGAHCDTLQLSGSPDQSGLLIQNTVIFASTNAAFIPTADATDITFDNTLVVAGDRMLVRYPLPAGSNAFTSGKPTAINAAGSHGQMSARNTTFIGHVRGTFREVEQSTVSGKDAPDAQSGSFTSDTSLANIGADWLDAAAPMPTDERLRSLWVLD